MNRIFSLVKIISVIVVLMSCSGCFMAIQQYQRENLGDTIMYFDYDAEESLLNGHIYPRREGSSGGYSGAGGGCGC